MDLDAETITTINYEKKTYSVMTFAQMKQAMEEAIKRGVVKAEWATPRNEDEGLRMRAEAIRILSRREYSTTVNAHEVHEVLLVAKWFRIRPLELQNTIRLPDLKAQ